MTSLWKNKEPDRLPVVPFWALQAVVVVEEMILKKVYKSWTEKVVQKRH